MENSPQSRGRFARFSIRELLLATVAIAAMVAVFVQRRPFDQHAMLQSFDPKRWVLKTCQDLELPASIPSSGTSSGSSPGGYYIEADLYLQQLSYEDTTRKLMPELQQRMGKLIDEQGGEDRGRSVTGSRENGMSRFSFHYQRAGIRGIVRFFAMQNPDGSPRLLMLLDEY